MKGVFINYRREDSIGYAGRIYDRISGHFGKDRVFMDIDTISPGDDFRQTIEQTCASSGVVLALIAKSWATLVDRNGRRRLDNPRDFVRLELARALTLGIRVIPVLLDEAEMPDADILPDDLKDLAYRQAVEISSVRFHYDIDRLIGVVDNIFARMAADQAAQERPPQRVEPQTQPKQVERERQPELGPAGAGPATAPAQVPSVEQTPEEIPVQAKQAEAFDFAELIGVRSRPLKWSRIVLFALAIYARFLARAIIYRHFFGYPFPVSLLDWAIPPLLAICVLSAFAKVHHRAGATIVASLAYALLTGAAEVANLAIKGALDSHPARYWVLYLYAGLWPFFVISGLLIAAALIRPRWLGFSVGALAGAYLFEMTWWLALKLAGYSMAWRFIWTPSLSIAIFCAILLTGDYFLKRREASTNVAQL